MPTDSDKKLNGTPEPFRRLVAWGRPPATVFRAGPLPRGTGLSPRPAQPPMPVGPGILTGSMIPRAMPTPTPEPAPTPVPVPAEPPGAPTPRPRETPVAAPAPAAAPLDHAADLAVRPLPSAKSGPGAPATAPQPDTLPALQPTVGGEVGNATGPHPQGAAPVRKIANRMPLYVGIALAALAVLTLGAWIWTRPPATVPVPAAAVVAAETLPTVPVPAIVPAETPPAPDVAEVAEAAVAPGPATPAAALRPAITPPAVARPPAVAPAPAPQPTAAERPQTDPDAPVATRPQPIGQGGGAASA